MPHLRSITNGTDYSTLTFYNVSASYEATYVFTAVNQCGTKFIEVFLHVVKGWFSSVCTCTLYYITILNHAHASSWPQLAVGMFQELQTRLSTFGIHLAITYIYNCQLLYILRQLQHTVCIVCLIIEELSVYCCSLSLTKLSKKHNSKTYELKVRKHLRKQIYDRICEKGSYSPEFD